MKSFVPGSMFSICIFTCICTINFSGMEYDRYKIVVQVVIGEQRGEGVKYGSFVACFKYNESMKLKWPNGTVIARR